MATAKDFVQRISKVDGVAGCLLVRHDGVLLGQTVAEPENYLSLMVISGRLGREVMERAGFSYCRHHCFSRTGKDHFYVFPIGRYLLGIVQRSDCYVPDMLATVYRLIDRVSTAEGGNKATEGRA